MMSVIVAIRNNIPTIMAVFLFESIFLPPLEKEFVVRLFVFTRNKFFDCVENKFWLQTQILIHSNIR
jgi:hypothetical protein